MSQRSSIYRTAFRYRDFRWLTLSAAQTRVGDFLYNVALFAVVFERTHSAAWVSITAVLIRVPRVVLPPFAGVLADRVERRNLMVVLNVASAVVMAVLAICVWRHAPVGLLVGLAVLATCIDTPYGPAEVGLLPSIVPEDALAAANAVSGGLESLAIVVGPAIGGVLLVAGTPATAFALNAGTFVAAVLCLLQVRRGPVPERGPEEEGRNGLFAGLHALRADANVVVVASGLVATCFAVGASGVLFVLLSDERLGTGAHGYGYLLAAIGVGGLLGSLLSDRLAAVKRMGMLVVVVLLVGAAAMAALGVIRIAGIAYLLTATFGAAYVLLEVLSVTIIQRFLQSAVLGQAIGMLDAVTFAAVLVGAAVAAPIHDAAGITTAFAVAAALPAAAAGLTLLRLKRLDAQSAREAATLAPVVALLGNLDVLTGASRSALERLAAAAREVPAPSGTDVVTEGDPADDFFVLVDGTAAVSSDTGGRLRTLGSGDCFGEIGLLERRPRTATVRVTTDSVLLQMPGETFVDVVTEAPATADAFGAMVSSRLASSRELERRP
ncbi:MAG: MFS transporter [Actinomycetes bacterium]